MLDMRSSTNTSEESKILFSRNGLFIVRDEMHLFLSSERHHRPRATVTMFERGSLVLEIDEFFFDGKPHYEIILSSPLSMEFLEFIMDSPIPTELMIFLLQEYV